MKQLATLFSLTILFVFVTVTQTFSQSVTTLCITKNSQQIQVATLFVDVDVNGNYDVKLVIARSFNDNTYGSGVIGWPGNNHKFKHLTSSDYAQFKFKNGNGQTVLQFNMDYLSQTSSVPSCYTTLGHTGGDGGMISGNAAHILSYNSSLNRNFNQYGYVLTTNSPSTNSNYDPNPNYPDWIFDMIFEVKISKNAFGASGFGVVEIPEMHHSPNKLGISGATKPLPCSGQPSSLGDKVWYDNDKDGIQDAGEAGIQNVTVKLYDCNDNLKATTITDVNGNYLFTNVTSGSYYVKFFPPSGFSFSPKDQGGDDAKDSDADVSTGKTICFTLPANTNDLKWDAGMYKPISAIGDKVWNDANKNGIQDVSEQGVAGIVVQLFDCSDQFKKQAVTDANGNYLFDSLVAGSYYVKFLNLPNYVFTIKDAGGNDALDSDVDPVTGKTICFSLPSNTTDLKWDAGIYSTKGSVGDKVWLDENKNGIQDSGEPGLPSVLVKLLDCSDNVLLTTVTDANGNYLFSDILPGSYKVEFSKPANYSFTNKDVGGNDAVDSDADTSTGKTTCFTLPIATNDMNWDAGLYSLKAAIGDFVWLDTDQNGIQNSGEAGVPNVTVKLFNCTDNLLAVTNTDATGKYLFPNLPSGNYYVQFILPGGFAFSPKDQGGDDTKDSDADVTTGKTICTALAPAQIDLKWDAGIYSTQPANQADLSINKSVNNENPEDGEVITYTITVNNNGPASATGVKVTDILSQGLLYQTSTASQGVYDTATGVWNIGTIIAGGTATLTISAKVDLSSITSSAFDLGPMKDYNVFVFENITQPSADTEGKMAVGKNAHLANYSIGDKLPNSNGTVDVFIVGKNLTYLSGAILGGNVVYGDSTNLPIPQVSINNGTLRKDSVIDFPSAKAYALNLSGQLAAYTANGTVTPQWGGLFLSGNDPFLNVFYVSGAALSTANDFRITAPNGSVVLVNIDGTNVSWTGGLVVNGTVMNNVIYNFTDATTITIQGIDVRGSILAPKAHVNFVSGVQNGQMICNSLEGMGQFNLAPFIGNIPVEVDIKNIAEITASAVYDPDSTPGNGNESEDDYSAVTIYVNNFDSTGTGGTGGGSFGTWVPVGNFNLSEVVWCLANDNNNDMLAGTVGGKIYRSSDNGQNWLHINSGMTVGMIWSIDVASNGTIYAGTEVGVFKSTNGGINWNTTALSGKDARAVSIDQSGNIYAGTWGFGVYKSTDQGASWQEKNNGIIFKAVHAFTINPLGELFVGTFGGGVYKSTDNGNNWVNTNMGYEFVWALGSTSDNKIIAGTYGLGMFVTTNSGSSWLNTNSGLPSSHIYTISVDASDNIYISAWAGGIYVSTNGGVTWNTMGLKGFGVSSILVNPSSHNLFAGTGDGKIYMNVNNPSSSKEENTIPTAFSLEQNYPNPFNPETIIEFSLPAQRDVTLKIYNTLGEEVKTLINENLKPGRYAIPFNASGLASGVYIYRLNAGDFVSTKKSLLLK